MKYFLTDDSLNTLIDLIKSRLTEEQVRAIIQEELNNKEPDTPIINDPITLIEGQYYHFAGQDWICAENKNGFSILQSNGITSGQWPGYIKDSVNPPGMDNVDISEYYPILKQLYDEIKIAEYIREGNVKGKGLYLPTIANCNIATSGENGSGYYIDALKIAASRYNVLGATASGAWLGSISTKGYAWFVFTDGRVLNYGIQTNTYSIAPCFELDLTKVTLNGDIIELREA